LKFLIPLLLLTASICAQDTVVEVNDVTQLNPIKVKVIIRPTKLAEIVDAVRHCDGPISIGGGHYSMGGQTATENSLHIDMRDFDSILHFSKVDQEITVEAGITWRKIQEYIDTFGLSVSIMQSYSNFSVGGSLSVNVHGRYVGQGPILSSVKEIEMVLASGEIVRASNLENSELFYAAIGGYGGLGVIAKVVLKLSTNCKVERSDRNLNVEDYASFFMRAIRYDTAVIFHSAFVYPKKYKKVRAISYTATTKEVTVKERLVPIQSAFKLNQLALKFITDFPGGKWMRQYVFDPIMYLRNPIEWRNYEASYDVLELEPKSRIKSTYVLQEYFVPIQQFDVFYPKLAEILKKNQVNVVNVSIRHAKQDPGSVMAWARSEVFAFVLYYKQGTKSKDIESVKLWTRQLIDAALLCGGTYYLPYQIWGTSEQFLLAYPNFKLFCDIKRKYDPSNKFRNKLWDAYFK